MAGIDPERNQEDSAHINWKVFTGLNPLQNNVIKGKPCGGIYNKLRPMDAGKSI